MNELLAAVRHLDRAVALKGTPAERTLPDGTTVTAAQLDAWIARHTIRLHTLLDQLGTVRTHRTR